MTMTIGQAFDRIFGADAPVDFRAFDGSRGGSGSGPASLGSREETNAGPNQPKGQSGDCFDWLIR